MKPVEALHDARWRAELELVFRADGEHTRLVRRRHCGPLVVQRPFYPEGSRLCQMLVVHPPGGIAGGDELELDISAQEEAWVQLTTPGAGKWYRGFGRKARQSVRIRVGNNAMCEWLPQENIVFDGALAQMSVEVELADEAVFCGWDFTCLGRPGSGEVFGEGVARQLTSISRAGRPLFREQVCLDAADVLRSAPSCLSHHCAYGAMLVAGKRVDDDILEAARGVFDAETSCGVTRVGEVLVARWVGDKVETGRRLFTRLWSVLRPWYAGRIAVTPRIWAT